MLHRVGRVFIATRQLLCRQSRPVVHHGNDPAGSFVLHQNVYKFPRGHGAGHLGKAKGRIELSLHIEADAGSAGAVLRVRVLGVLDEIPAALPVATVILPVKLDGGPVLALDLGILLDFPTGLGKDAVGTHLGGEQFLSDKVGAGARKCGNARPHGQPAGGGDFLAGRQNDFFGSILLAAAAALLAVVAAQGSDPDSHRTRTVRGSADNKGMDIAIEIGIEIGIEIPVGGKEPPQRRRLLETIRLAESKGGKLAQQHDG